MTNKMHKEIQTIILFNENSAKNGLPGEAVRFRNKP